MNKPITRREALQLLGISAGASVLALTPLAGCAEQPIEFPPRSLASRLSDQAPYSLEELAQKRADIERYRGILSASGKSTVETAVVAIAPGGNVLATGLSLGGACDVQEWNGMRLVRTYGTFTVGIRENGTICTTTSYASPAIYGWRNLKEVQGVTLGITSDGKVYYEDKSNDPQHIVADTVAQWRDISACTYGGDADLNLILALKSDGTVCSLFWSETKDTVEFYDEYQSFYSEWHDVAQIFDLRHALTTDGRVLIAGAMTEIDEAASEWSDIVDLITYEGLSWLGYFHIDPYMVGLRRDGTVVISADDSLLKEISVTATNVIQIAIADNPDLRGIYYLRANGTIKVAPIIKPIGITAQKHLVSYIESLTDIVYLSTPEPLVALKADGTVVPLVYNAWKKHDEQTIIDTSTWKLW